jgi:Eco57I restriction-modification methylase/TaqI-like C-terminal specificity domain/N-6 DNA Methylase
MPISFEQSKDAIARLVNKFTQDRDNYLGPVYNEAQARGEFIDPFFEALGWDMRNEQGAALGSREVVFEDTLEIQGQKKKPDYVFRLKRARKFYVEAKKPGVDLKRALEPAYQLRRYAWTAKLPLSLLTDFEELAVYDCRSKPAPTHKPTVGRANYLTFMEYADRWREVWDVFAHEALLNGSFDKYAQTNKRGTSEVDTEFLEEIEGWRDVLAHNMALRNPRLTIDELNDAVQRTIDRIIFLRMAEDRAIEDPGSLLRLSEGDTIYRGLVTLFRRADAKYNSGLFDVLSADNRLAAGLTVDDKALKPILANLYYPQSPYEFSVLPPEILGNVYEQFLGKVIRLTPSHQAKVEEKPEVKKAGGVYYTPAYIVQYIVKNTVGQLVEGKGPEQLRGLRVLDAACGSGSFLLGAYQYLLDHYLNWHTTNAPENHPRAVWRAGEEWRLTTAEKKRILTEHIFGVDIDRQAVEVTKLSLLLAVLDDGETNDSGSKQLALLSERAKERVLPNLDRNIKCGNSLIGPDYFTGQLLPDEAELRRVNAFDWQTAFPEAMKAGGFDCVIGNPPYIRVQTLQEWAPLEVEIYKKLYAAAGSGSYDIYVVFVEKGLSLLSKHGRLGFILPHKFFNAKYGETLRELIAAGKHLAQVVHFGDQQVFAGASTYTCLMFLAKEGANECQVTKVSDLAAWRRTGAAISGVVEASEFGAAAWNFAVGRGAALLERLSHLPVKLEHVTSRIFQGIKTGADKIYIVEEVERKDQRVKVYSREKEAEYWLEASLLHPLIKGGDSRRYSLSRTNRLVLFPYEPKKHEFAELLSEPDLKSLYPLTWTYLVDNKQYLENRERGAMRGSHWYAYSRNQAIEVMPLPKIITPDIALRSSFCLDETGEAFFSGGVAGGYGVLVSPEYSREYVLGLLNSRLLDWFNKQIATQMRGGYYSFESRFIRYLPILTPGLSDPALKQRHDQMIVLVNQNLDLHKRLAAAQDAGERERLQRLIDSTDRQTDALVYEFYELTPKEIAVVEAAAQGAGGDAAEDEPGGEDKAED